MVRSVKGCHGGPARLPLKLVTLATCHDLHLYAEDLAWFFGEAAMHSLGNPAYMRVVVSATTPAGDQLQPQADIKPTQLFRLWSFLAGSKADPLWMHMVWKFRLATLLVVDLGRFLQGHMEKEVKRRMIPAPMGDVAIQAYRNDWGWLCTDHVQPFLGSQERRSIATALSGDDNSGLLDSFSQLCDNGASAVEHWAANWSVTEKRTDLAVNRALAVDLTHRFL